MSCRSFPLIVTLVLQHDTDKSFYNISFPEDQCEGITTDKHELANCDVLFYGFLFHKINKEA